MQYALLVYDDESNQAESWEPEAREALLNEFAQLIQEMSSAGAFIASRRLATSDSTTTVRVRSGKVLTTDGPFAETKEALAGFILVECANLDEALSWAARVPLARLYRIEVRPVRTGHDRS